MFSETVKTDCILWLTEFKSPTKVQRMFKKKYGRNEEAPSRAVIRKWHGNFKETSLVSVKKKRRHTVEPQQILQLYEENPKQSLRRVANHLEVSFSTVRRALKSASYKNYRPQIVQALQPQDKTARVDFAKLILGKLSRAPNFLEKILFSDEAVFHTEGSVNKHNCSHWSQTNPDWIIEKSLNSPKLIVWAAVGGPGVIGPIFIEGNVDGDTYLALLKNDLYPAISNMGNSSELIFQQDGAPPHWARPVRNWLNEEMPGKWIGRGSPTDKNIAWPARSPDLTLMDYFVWGFVKSKVYVQNYENLEYLKNSIRAAFREISADMIASSLKNLQKRLKQVVQQGGRHIENKKL